MEKNSGGFPKHISVKANVIDLTDLLDQLIINRHDADNKTS